MAERKKGEGTKDLSDQSTSVLAVGAKHANIGTKKGEQQSCVKIPTKLSAIEQTI